MEGNEGSGERGAGSGEHGRRLGQEQAQITPGREYSSCLVQSYKYQGCLKWPLPTTAQRHHNRNPYSLLTRDPVLAQKAKRNYENSDRHLQIADRLGAEQAR